MKNIVILFLGLIMFSSCLEEKTKITVNKEKHLPVDIIEKKENKVFDTLLCINTDSALYINDINGNYMQTVNKYVKYGEPTAISVLVLLFVGFIVGYLIRVVEY